MREELQKLAYERTKQLKELIHEKLAAASPENDALAAAVEQGLLAIFERAHSLLESIANRAESKAEEDNDANGLFNIVTAFVARDLEGEFRRRRFFPMPGYDGDVDGFADLDAPPKPGCAGSLFLNCPYADLVERHCRRTYTGEMNGKAFRYKLVPYFGYLAAEKWLSRLAFLYGIERPLIFSPWSRRAVRIEYPGELPPDARPDFKFQDNGLSQLLIADALLMWNVDITRCDRWDNSYASPDGLGEKYVFEYQFADNANGFVLPDYAVGDSPRNFPLEASKSGKSIQITAPEKLAGEFDVVEIVPPALEALPDNCKIFTNDCKVDVLAQCQRPRSEADINSLLTALKLYGFQGVYVKDAEGLTAIQRYDSGHAYPRPRHSLLPGARNQKIPCAIRFSGNGAFLEDYAEYVISFLETRYPEYLWRGIR